MLCSLAIDLIISDIKCDEGLCEITDEWCDEKIEDMLLCCVVEHWQYAALLGY